MALPTKTDVVSLLKDLKSQWKQQDYRDFHQTSLVFHAAGRMGEAKTSRRYLITLQASARILTSY